MGLAPLCWFSVTPSTTHNQIRPFWCCFLSGWFCVRSRPLWVSPTSSPMSLGVSPAAASTSTGVCSQRFEALFPCWSPGLRVCLAPQLFLPVYLQTNVALPSLRATASPGPPAAALPRVLSAQLCLSTPPTGLGECFFFISLVVGLPYSSIFCQFWLFFVFKLLLSFFWLCEEAQYVYQRLHLSQKSGKGLCFNKHNEKRLHLTV